jgi:hypothetical protein
MSAGSVFPFVTKSQSDDEAKHLDYMIFLFENYIFTIYTHLLRLATGWTTERSGFESR